MHPARGVQKRAEAARKILVVPVILIDKLSDRLEQLPGGEAEPRPP